MKQLVLCLFLLAGIFSGFSQKAPSVALISGEYEYASMITLPALADYLESEYAMKTSYFERGHGEDIPKIEKAADADVLILCIRRLTLPEKQLAVVRNFIKAGKPVIGIRTTSHAFENWKSWDNEILGGNYHGHHKNHLKTTVSISGDKKHPLLTNINKGFVSGGSLYEVRPLTKDSTILMTGSVELKGSEPEPVAWTREAGDSKIMYTALGFPEDFEQSSFVQFIVNSIYYGLDRSIPSKKASGLSSFPSRKISIDAFAPLAKHHRTVALDVRTPGEYAQGHVKNAVNLNFRSKSLADDLNKLDKNRPYAVFCRSGGRSAACTKKMKELGFKFVYDFSGSMNAWEAAGKPTVK